MLRLEARSSKCLLIQALYVNWVRGFVVGLVIDWTVFIAGVLLVCAWLSAGVSP
jgi:hypothetical protein